MARLNEPPVVGESVEALKRRFMRQNRELAKSNSTLNIRIATLEADRSGLLSDNITLREENNQLRQELEKNLSKRALQNVGSVKDKLSAKVAELNELMLLLDKAHTEKPRPAPTPKPTRRRSYQRSPTQQLNWRATLYGPEVTGLAPIVEGKCFPRRTLEWVALLGAAYEYLLTAASADEIQNTLPDFGNAPESPELGPPPVAHFDPGDPIKTDLADKIGTISNDNGKEDVDVPRDLGFANLETRRKRRASSFMKEAKGKDDETALELSETSNHNSDALGQTLRAGAKRKLSVREDERDVATRSSDSDGFAFNRKTGSGTKPHRDETSTTKSRSESEPNKVSLDRKRDTSVLKLNRRALGEKSINTDPVVSPVKPKITAFLKSKDIEKEMAPRLKTRGKTDVEKPSQRNTTITQQPLDEPKDLPPITPAPPETNLFSPLDSFPSSSRPLARDTPPPSDLSQPSEGARPSRRQRAAVSYAEPSLRDKMRRPGKELVDAVIPSTTKPDPTTTRIPDASITSSTHVRKEDNTDLAVPENEWKKLPISKPHDPIEPASPLGSKSTGTASADLPPTVITDRRRRSSAAPRAPSDGHPSSTNPLTTTAGGGGCVSQSTIAALVAGSQKRLSRAREAAEAQRRASGEKGMGLDIYDFDDSEAPSSGSREAEGGNESGIRERKDGKERAGATTGATAARVSRRHSSMSDIRTGLGNGATKRGQEGVMRSISVPNGGVAKREEKKRDEGSEEDKNGSLRRAERAANRRKSMMI